MSSSSTPRPTPGADSGSEYLRPSPRALPCVIDVLRPVVSLFQPFLADADAARLLRTSRTAALALLAGHVFRSHTFQPTSLASLIRLRDLCLRYGLRVTQLALPPHIHTIAVDPSPPHQSPIPTSVIVLSLGSLTAQWTALKPSWAALCAAAVDWQERPPWSLSHSQQRWPQSDGAQAREWQLSWVHDPLEDDPILPRFASPIGELHCPLPPGLLPHGLRVLLFNRSFNYRLEPGSLPSTLTFLQLAWSFEQQLLPGVLPASLLYLSLPYYRHRLLPGSLPASLERLRLGHWSPPVGVGVLPAGLKALHLGNVNDSLQPHVLPPSLLYLSFGASFNQLCLPNVLPCSLVELHFGHCYNQPTPAGVLPSSLRRLTLGSDFSQQLEVGALPEGLLFLRAEPDSRYPPSLLAPFQPGVLPSTLLGLDLSNRCVAPLPSDVIPLSVRWVRLSSKYRDERIEAVLPPLAECRWFEYGDNTSWRIV